MAVKFSQFVVETDKANVNYLVGWDGTENVQITPANLLGSYPSGSGATGQVAFFDSASSITGDNDLYWDNVNKRLGIGTASPSVSLHVDGFARLTGSLQLSGTNRYIYNIANSALLLGTNNTERMRIDSSGNVGINTTSPSAKLEVDGTLIATGISQLGSGGSNVYLTSSSAGNVGIGTSSPSQKLDVVGNINLDGTSTRVFFGGNNTFIGENSNSNELILRGGGSTTAESVYIDTNGNVGIGTSSPSQKLHVFGTTRISGTNNLDIFSDNTAATFNLASNARGFLFKNLNGDLVTINSSGNVGIGTSSPQTKFHVSGGQALFASDTAANPILPFGIEVYRNTGGNSNVLIHQDDGNHEAVLHMRCGGNDTKIRTGPNTYALRIDTEQVTDALVLTNGASARVGIGTTSSPSVDLEIGTSGSADTEFLMQSDQAGKYFKVSSSGNFTELKSVGDQNLFLNSSGTGGYISFLAGNSERMRINYDGKVGIGTTTPGRLLQVKDTSGVASIAITSANTGTAQLELGGTSDNDIAGISYNSSTQKLFLKTDNTGQLYVDNSGNVGIGTDSPNAKLNVISADETVARFERNSGSGFAAIDIKDSVGTTGNSAIRFSDTTATSGEINYEHADDSLRISTSSSEKMRITSSGNVGIGVTSPASKLEVDGGDIEVDDSASGLILRSPDGTRYRVTVANGGTLSVSAV